LIAVPPAINSTLNQATLLSEVRVELCQRPAYSVALTLVVETVAFVFVLSAARAWVHAVRILELRGEIVNVDRLDVAPDRVLHLHAISGVLECNPLHTCIILTHN